MIISELNAVVAGRSERRRKRGKDGGEELGDGKGTVERGGEGQEQGGREENKETVSDNL